MPFMGMTVARKPGGVTADSICGVGQMVLVKVAGREVESGVARVVS